MPWLTNSRRTWITLVVLVVVVFGATVYVAPTQWNRLVYRPGLQWLQVRAPKPFRLGLDLKGGTHLVYEADTSAIPARDQRAAMEGVRDVIERRVNALGVAEPIVQLTQVENHWRLIVELAGVYDTDRAIQAIGATPVLEFRELAGDVKLTPEQQKDLDQQNAAIKKRMQEEILPQALAKDADFGTLSRVHSQDPGSASRDGDLGWFRRGTMVKEFDTAVFDQLRVGQVTRKLVETEYGWHIIKKTGEREVDANATPEISAIGTDGKPVNVQVKTESAGTDTPAAKINEVRASHILFRKKTPQDILGINGQWAPTGLGGKQLNRAALGFDPTTNQPLVSLEFDAEGTKLFEEVTTRNVGKPIAIFIDGQSPVDVTGDGKIDTNDVYAPNVRERIIGGSAVISGLTDVTRAKELANRLQAGALPVPITILAQSTIGPTLGAAAIAASLRAALYGYALVALFMLIRYRLPGLIADIALVIYILFVLAVMKLLGATLTLSGLAGFVMSIGVAVDANVLIFERFREEIRRGRSLLDAIGEGFRRAWTSIRDANVAALITCVILATFSSSVVKGFAVTLAIGVLVSMFTAITTSRTFLMLVARFVHRPWWYGVRPQESSTPVRAPHARTVS